MRSSFELTRWVAQHDCATKEPRAIGPGLFQNRGKSLDLAGFLVVGVLALPLAVLAHFDAFAIVDLVLHRDVVAALAAFTGECDGDALVVFCHGELVLKVLVLTSAFGVSGGRAPGGVT